MVDFYNNHFEIYLLNYLKSLDLPRMTIKFYHNPFDKPCMSAKVH